MTGQGIVIGALVRVTTGMYGGTVGRVTWVRQSLSTGRPVYDVLLPAAGSASPYDGDELELVG